MFAAQQRKAPFGAAVFFGLSAFLASAPAGQASTYTYNLDCTTVAISSCVTSHLYGTITVADTGGAGSGKVSVTVQLASTDEFETNVVTPTFAFNIKNATVNNISGITNSNGTALSTNGFSTVSGSPFTISSPAFGTFSNGIECINSNSGFCGGTLGDTVTFLVTGTSGPTLVAADFAPNAKGFTFAADVGPASGGSSYIAAAPEPQWYGAVLVAGLVALGAARRRSVKATDGQA